MKTTLLFLSVFLSANLFGQTFGNGVTDIDGNFYESVIIGNQEWMAENLTTKSYSNGDSIPNSTINWGSLNNGAWVNYNNDSSFNAQYGKLYNWFTVEDSRNVCPVNWHVPTSAEWDTLSSFLGVDAGGKLKHQGTALWQSPNTGATNSTGFRAYPSGYRQGSSSAIFELLGQYTIYWTSTSNDPQTALDRTLKHISSNLFSGTAHKNNGHSIRCIKNPCSSSTGVDVQSACDSYTWINGQTYTSDNNTDTDTLISVDGCDSIVTLDLTIHSSDFKVAFFAENQFYSEPPYSVIFTNQTPEFDSYDFEWDFGDGTVIQSNEINVSHEYVSNGLYTVTLTATDSATGCTDFHFEPYYIYISGFMGVNELSNSSKNLIKILDLMGRETSFKPNTPLIYVYDDGSIEKVFSVEY